MASFRIWWGLSLWLWSCAHLYCILLSYLFGVAGWWKFCMHSCFRAATVVKTSWSIEDCSSILILSFCYGISPGTLRIFLHSRKKKKLRLTFMTYRDSQHRVKFFFARYDKPLLCGNFCCVIYRLWFTSFLPAPPVTVFSTISLGAFLFTCC